ncbi:MAG: PAAR domain-containing protein [Variovorax sp.]|nr:PAAR domain-containing protein [Variovorax sp.]
MGAFLPLIRVGDKTSHGGTVIEGFPHGQCDVYGVSGAGLGHRVTCPIHPGIHRIAEGEPHYRVHGVPVALEGMRTTCGAELIASQQNARGERRGTASLADIGIYVQGDPSTGGMGASGYSEAHRYDQSFHLIDEGDGRAHCEPQLQDHG